MHRSSGRAAGRSRRSGRRASAPSTAVRQTDSGRSPNDEESPPLQRSFSMPDVSPIELIVLGPKRLPEMGKSLGKGIREFKQSVSGDEHPPLPAPIPPAETTDQS